MDVQISARDTGRVIGIFPVILGGTLGQTDEEYFAEAWRCAVDDRLVPEGEKDKYNFKSLGG